MQTPVSPGDPKLRSGKFTGIAIQLSKLFNPNSPQSDSSQPTLLNEQDIVCTLQSLQKKIALQSEEQANPDHTKFLIEAKELGITVVENIPDSTVHTIEGTVLILQDIGENSQLSIQNGGAIILGNIGRGTMVEIRDNGKSNSTLGKSNYGITVVGFIGDHVRLTSSSNIIAQDCGDFVQLRASHTIKTNNIGKGANLLAKELIETADIGDDLRTVHFARKFVAGNIGNRAVIKAGSILAQCIASGAEIVASYDCEARQLGNNGTVTARSILLESVGMDCQLFAALGQNKISSAGNL